MKKCLLWPGLALLLLPAILHAQGDAVQTKIVNAINLFYQAYPQEKIHIQFNKNSYAPGEEIWLKSYLLPFHDTNYSPISKIEYIELVDMNNALVKRLVVPVENGTAVGHFTLGTQFMEGVYHVRAYTAWMLNFDSAFFFNRDIPVFAHNRPMANTPGKSFTVQFYPEGGNLVQGLTSLVAYKAADEYGNPVMITGKMVDDKGNTRALLHTGADGMGSFNMHPEDGFVYTTTASMAGGPEKTFVLPPIKKSGIVLHVVDKPDSAGNSQLFFHIARSKAEKELYSSITVYAHTAKYNQLLNINFDPKYAGDYNDTILVAADPLGLKNDGQSLAHITIFNSNGAVLADRMAFLHSTANTGAVSLQAGTIAAMGKNDLTLQVPGDIAGQYSVAVTNADANSINNGNNIFNNFYLPGFENTASLQDDYFSDTSAETYKSINLLMLTNKWPYYDWHNMLGNKFPKIKFLPEQSLYIRGNVSIEKYNKKEAYTEKSIPLMMKDVKDSISAFLNIPVNDSGNFVENNLYFHDTASFYYQSGEQKSKKTVVVAFTKTETDSVLALPFYYKPYKIINAKYVPATMPAAERDNTDSALLKNVTVNAVAKNRVDSIDAAYTSGMFSGTRNFIYLFDLTNDPVTEDDHSTNVLQYLQGRVPGLTINGDIQNVPTMYWHLTTGLFTANNIAQNPVAATILNMPVFFINESQVNSNQSGEDLGLIMSQLTNIKVADIAYIKVYQPGTFYGAQGGAAHGAVAIYLKKGYKSGNSLNSLKKYGFSYIPNFGDGSFNTDKQTIYWNPDVRTNPQTHSATITFTNVTGAKRIRVVVEGFDKKGQPIHIEKIFAQQ